MQPGEALSQARIRACIGEPGQTDLSHGGRDAEVIDQADQGEEERKDHGDPTALERSPEGGQRQPDPGSAELEWPQHPSHQVSGDLRARDHREGGSRDDATEEKHGAEPGAEGDPEHRPQHGPGREGHGVRWFPIASAL